jgi:hypothetical protein
MGRWLKLIPALAALALVGAMIAMSATHRLFS